MRMQVARSEIARRRSHFVPLCSNVGDTAGLPCLFFFAIYLSVARAAASMLQVAIMDMEMTALVATLRADIHTPPNGNGAEQRVQHNLQRFNCICLRLMQLGVNQRQICADLQICLLHTTYIHTIFIRKMSPGYTTGCLPHRMDCYFCA